MAVEQSTTMVLKVDLQCRKCYKKVKKVLCKFPEIRDQVYDEKQNTVTIKVVYCCPEKLKQKIQSKGGKSIKSIDIKPPPKPSTDQKPGDTKPSGDKRKVTFAELPTKPKEQPKPKPQETAAPKPASPQPAPKPLVVTPGYPITIPSGVYFQERYEGRGEVQCYSSYYGRPVYDSWVGGSSSSRSHFDYFTEENPSSCTIM